MGHGDLISADYCIAGRLYCTTERLIRCKLGEIPLRWGSGVCRIPIRLFHVLVLTRFLEDAVWRSRRASPAKIMYMGSDDSFITLFGADANDMRSSEERLAFLQGYQDALASSDPARPLGLIERGAPAGFEQHYRAGQAKAQSDLEEKNALAAAVVSAVIAAI